jgi:serine-type D-Ala-D-Ala carboxypeptidase/endopeptidase
MKRRITVQLSYGVKHSLIGLFIIAGFWGHAFCQAPSTQVVLSDSEIHKILAERIDKDQQSVGIVVGVIEPAGRRVVAYGSLDKDDKRALNGDTVFEIGSVTKVFTSVLLADMVQRGEVALTDPVAKYLPPGVKVPERGGRQITLQDLATQSSALPRLPSNLAPKDPANPYADYSVEQLYQFLSSYQLTRDIGSQYEYSNLGVGLLGHALTRRAGMDYEALVRSRIGKPLGMNSTGVTLSSDMKTRLATGHDAELKPVANWDLPTLAGAGALRSTANDMLTFLAANLESTNPDSTKSPLAPAMASMLKVRRPTGEPGLEIALGWHILTRDGHEIVWHNGGTGGYRTFLGFDPKNRVGVVVLSNTFTNAGVDDIGRHLLDNNAPLSQPSKERKDVTVDPKLFDGYVGRYELAPNFTLTVTREDNHLFVQATGQPKFQVFAEGERDYFYKVVDAQITFESDGKGKAAGLVLHQNGDHHANRIESEAPPKEHRQVLIDTKLFDGYVGSYQLAPNFILTVSREGSQLFVQATGQTKIEAFAEGERNFFLKVVDAQITFDIDGRGRATGLTLHQNGLDQPAKRIE